MDTVVRDGCEVSHGAMATHPVKGIPHTLPLAGSHKVLEGYPAPRHLLVDHHHL
jgi:hypothetical protein